MTTYRTTAIVSTLALSAAALVGLTTTASATGGGHGHHPDPCHHWSQQGPGRGPHTCLPTLPPVTPTLPPTVDPTPTVTPDPDSTPTVDPTPPPPPATTDVPTPETTPIRRDDYPPISYETRTRHRETCTTTVVISQERLAGGPWETYYREVRHHADTCHTGRSRSGVPVVVEEGA